MGIFKKYIKLYCCAVFKYWWSIAIGAIGGGARLLTEIWPNLMIPNWLWITMLVGGFMVAQFLAWCDLHKKFEEQNNDENNSTLKDHADAIREQTKAIKSQHYDPHTGRYIRPK